MAVKSSRSASKGSSSVLKKRTPTERAAAEKRVRAAMKKGGYKTLEEYARSLKITD